MSNGWEKYERHYNDKFKQQSAEKELDQAMPFNRFAFWFGLAGILVGLLCALIVRHYHL